MNQAEARLVVTASTYNLLVRLAEQDCLNQSVSYHKTRLQHHTHMFELRGIRPLDIDEWRVWLNDAMID